MREVTPGIWHWTARHPKIGIEVSSYFLPGPGVLLDPLEPRDDRLDELGPAREILVTNRHHLRHSVRFAERFGCRIRAPAVGMHEFAGDEPIDPYDFGDAVAGGAAEVHEVDAICSDEAAVHFPALRAVAVADGVVNYDGLRFVRDDYMDDPERTKEGLRAAYRALVEQLDFEHLLPAHGEPVIGDGREQLRRFAG